MLKYALALRVIKDLIIDRAFVRPIGEGTEAETALDLIMETVSVLDYDTDYLPGAEFVQVCNDSRKVTAGSIFTAIPGAAVDGKKFIPQALEKGASVIISQENMQDLLLPGTVNLVVKNAYLVYAMLCEAMYDFPVKDMDCFAVTGTNGKTTTAMLTRLLLHQADAGCGMISTVEYDLGGGDVKPAERTTPEAAELFAYFANMRKRNLHNMVMEVSSHALAQNRIGSLKFQSAIFTNLTGDHLDYHHTMEEYFRVKELLFTRHLAPGGKAVINCDDPYGRILAEKLPPEQVVSFGCSNGQWRIENIYPTAHGSTFELVCATIRKKFTIPLAGLYNISNTVGTVLALHATGKVSLQQSAEILQNKNFSVPGRLEKFTLNNGAEVFVDYAHTADALKNVLTTLQALEHRNLITVFGCGGDRDKSKRPIMGKIAAGASDKLYITSDNPRTEDPQTIIREICSGIPADCSNWEVIPDREQAIIAALKNALPGDIILIAGKGHENYQEINGVKHHFDDREIVIQNLAGC